MMIPETVQRETENIRCAPPLLWKDSEGLEVKSCRHSCLAGSCPGNSTSVQVQIAYGEPLFSSLGFSSLFPLLLLTGLTEWNSSFAVSAVLILDYFYCHLRLPSNYIYLSVKVSK